MDNYDFVETVGEGTYGKVYKARVKANGRIVAIKKFKESDEDEAVQLTSLISNYNAQNTKISKFTHFYVRLKKLC